MRVLIATNNKHKVKEISDIFRGTGIELLSPADIGLKLEVDENGSTFEENAMKKADEFCKASGFVCIADDSGLAVDCLSGAPGVYSARYGGEGLDDKGRTELLLKNMSGSTDRNAAFVCCIATVFPNGQKITARGECHGKIAQEASGTNGFGYDPVFVPDGYDKTFAELSENEKNSISHRGRALAQLAEKLSEHGII